MYNMMIKLKNFVLFANMLERIKLQNGYVGNAKILSIVSNVFEIYHKFKQTRNHPYYDVAKNGQEILATKENLKTSIEQIVKKLNGNFEKLDQEFEDEDQTSIAGIC